MQPGELVGCAPILRAATSISGCHCYLWLEQRLGCSWDCDSLFSSKEGFPGICVRLFIFVAPDVQEDPAHNQCVGQWHVFQNHLGWARLDSDYKGYHRNFPLDKSVHKWSANEDRCTRLKGSSKLHQSMLDTFLSQQHYFPSTCTYVSSSALKNNLCTGTMQSNHLVGRNDVQT